MLPFTATTATYKYEDYYNTYDSYSVCYDANADEESASLDDGTEGPYTFVDSTTNVNATQVTIAYVLYGVFGLMSNFFVVVRFLIMTPESIVAGIRPPSSDSEH